MPPRSPRTTQRTAQGASSSRASSRAPKRVAERDTESAAERVAKVVAERTTADQTDDSPDTYRRQPRQSRGQRRVDLLLDAAADVIAEHGLNAATAEAIAQRAKTAKGSLYQFFPNRDAVVAALALRFADELRSIHERAFATDPRGLPLNRLIDRIVRPLAAFHDRNPAFRRVFMTADAPIDSTGAAPNRIRSQLFESIVDRLDILFAARNPRLSSRERRRAAVVSATIGQALLARRDRVIASERKPILDDLRHVLFAYLTPLLDTPAVAAAAPRKRAPRTVTG